MCPFGRTVPTVAAAMILLCTMGGTNDKRPRVSGAVAEGHAGS